MGVSRAAEYLINYFEKTEHDIVVIDKDNDVIEYVTDKYSVTGICGSGASREVLQKSGVKYANYLVSLTPIDEINLLSSSMAKSMGAKHVICAVESQELIKDIEYIKSNFDIDDILVPNDLISQAIEAQVCFNVANKVSFLFNNRITLSEITVSFKSFFSGKRLQEIKPLLKIDFLVVGVLRDNKLIIPKGDFVIKEGDTIGIMTTNDKMLLLFSKLNLIHNPIKSAFIIGGGSLGEEVLNKLLKMNIKISVIDKNIEKCKYLLEKYKNVNVICANAMDVDIYDKLDISSKSAFVCTTGVDETNLLSSIIARGYDVSENITIVKTQSYEKILKKTMFGITISTPAIIAQKVLEKLFVLKNDDSHYYAFDSSMLKTYEFRIYEGFKFIGSPIKSHRYKKGVIIGAIQRNDEVIVPNGDEVLLLNDKIFVLAQAEENILGADDLFY